MFFCSSNREPRTANREPRTANREPRTANREPRTANRSDPGLRTTDPGSLEYYLRRQLNIPRQVVLARHLSEAGVRRVGVRIVEHDGVERVQELDVELRPDATAKLHLLHDRDVPQAQERAPDAVDARREVA